MSTSDECRDECRHNLLTTWMAILALLFMGSTGLHHWRFKTTPDDVHSVLKEDVMPLLERIEKQLGEPD